MTPRTVLRPALIALAILVSTTAALVLLSSASASDDESSGGDVRRADGRIVRELPNLRTATSRTFATSAGTNVTRVYSDPVNFRSGDRWLAIDSRLRPSDRPGAALANTADAHSVELPDSLADPVEVRDGDDHVRFSLAGARGVAPSGGGLEARYDGALPGVDVAYESRPGSLKESLVLASPDAGGTFRFSVETSDGLQARENDAGGIDFVRDGKVRLSFAPPHMRDSARVPAVSRDVSYDLSGSAGEYDVVLRADRRWLADDDRTYPVVIDPTTNVDTNDDCYMASGTDANTSFCGYTDPYIQVGKDGNNNLRRGFMRVDTSSIPKTAEVIDGKLFLYVEAGTQRNVDLHRVTRQSTSARTWNKYDGTNSWTTAGGDVSTSRDGFNSAVGGSVGWYSIPARKLAQGWVDGSIQNYGLILKENGTTAGVLTFTGDAANDPYMEFEWVHRTGEQERWTFAEQTLSDRTTLKTNVANGNLILEEADISIPGTAGHDLDFKRHFNNMELDTSSSTDDLGKYWRQNQGWGVWLAPESNDTARALNGASDFWAVYDDRQADGTYTTPTGMNADLKRNADGTHTLTDRQSNRKLNFNTSHLLSSDQDRNGNTISYTYGGPGGKLTAIKDTHDQGTANNTLTLTYTAAGYVDKVTDRTSPTVRTWDYNYTGQLLTSYVNPEGDTTSYAYDASENLDKVTDPRGTVTDMDYDSDHRVVSIKRDEANGGPETKYEYPTTVSTDCQDTGDPNDPLDDVVGETIERDPLYPGTGTTHTTKYCWDRLLRVRKTFDGRGESRKSDYTSNSDVKTLKSMGTQQWDLSYLGDRPEHATAPAAPGQSTGLRMTFGYDDVNHGGTSDPLHWLPVSFKDTQKKQTDFAYDSEGNLTAVKLPLSGTPQITIAPNGNGTTQSITDARGNATSYTYETDGDLDTIDRPSTLVTETLDYDVVHRLTSQANAHMPSVTETYGYDKLDRMTSVAFAGANTVTYGYDDNGNMTSRSDATGSSTYVYDRLNRMTQENLPGGRTNNYTYDAASNLATLQDAGGTTTYTYGASNLLATLQAPGDSAATSYTYNKDAQRTKTSYPNGVVLTMDYEDLTDTAGAADANDKGPNRLKSIEAKKTGGSVLTKFTYSYIPNTTLCGGTADDTGLRHQVTNKDGVTSKYCYDALSRLTKADDHVVSGSTTADYDWTLDAAGNITKAVKNGTATSFGFDAANRLCWRVGGTEPDADCTPTPTGATTYAYDTSGNLDTSSGGLNLDYNSKGQTTSMTGLSGGTATTMSYAGTNQFERFTAGSTTFTNNALGAGAETTGTSTTYYRRDNEGGLHSERLASTGNPVYYYAFDGLGSVSALTDSAGAAPATYTYEPYGETTASGTAPSTHNPWRYASSYFDAGTGFYKMGMRYYHPTLMRWTQQDSREQPLDPVQSNRYSYVGGDPIDYADPNGTLRVCTLSRGCKTLLAWPPQFGCAAIEAPVWNPLRRGAARLHPCRVRFLSRR
ncbi:MAG TPA: DNRLRE domain-containing protein [Thermoleophilaceae bacterium]|jgi:RHS repeat-associated protein